MSDYLLLGSDTDGTSFLLLESDTDGTSGLLLPHSEEVVEAVPDSGTSAPTQSEDDPAGP